MRSRLLASSLVVITALLGPSVAAAQPAKGKPPAPKGPPAAEQPKSDAERALDLGYQADDLFARGKWAEAYEKFKAADDLAHSPAFVLYMARCRRNDGRLVDAEAIYTRVATEPLPADAPKPFRAAVENGVEELAELKKKVPTLRAVAKHASGTVDVHVDGKPVAADTPVELDPGSHEVVGANAGKTTKKVVTLAAGSGETRVELDFASSDDPHPGWGHGTKAWGAISMAIAAASAGAAIVTGSIAWRLRDDVASRCVGVHCSVKDRNEILQSYRYANASTGLFIFGGVSAVAGTVLLIVRPGRASTSVALSPSSVVLSQSF